ncbi:hypothetical protein GLAREA_04439 [Glarea lozoyensis ATCC 20868]|uniref:DUF7704 domain-containing protein n=1 Tax=Glarea lozoyensis (strain ATCC 20868 / MF5171) TaxID=1116229 RepID=S3DM98_GLAL2|nr:uncharacterized protein GLAREA_04439 [Glarea lozoyensis ATCC 20868]EPE27648.1 hypothetical protein GLAREA_04439 [Glarea lozoyensis ATCC 20868]
MSQIPKFYRIFFLYIDPLICLSGIYIFFFDHALYISNGTPTAISSFSSTALTPFTDYLLTALGAYSLFVFCMQVLLLHGFKNAANGVNVRIWRIVQFGILLIDFGLVYAVWRADERGFWDLKGWDEGEWTNNGILGGVIVVRSAFLLGVGGVGRVDS